MKKFINFNEFSSDQLTFLAKFWPYRLFSMFSVGFGPQFFMLYMIQHLNMEQRSMQTALMTVLGLIAVFSILTPFVRKNIHKWVMPCTFLWAGIAIGCDLLLLLQYPVAVIFIISATGKTVGSYQKKGFGKLNNRCFRGDQKTTFSFIREAVDATGLTLGSIACWICREVPLEYIIVADIILSIIDVFMVYGRYALIKTYLQKHPYKEEEDN